MATELTVQSERAFQKQPHIFLNAKSKSKSKRVGKGGRRWYKDVGLGFRTPKTAIEGSYIGMEEIFVSFLFRIPIIQSGTSFYCGKSQSKRRILISQILSL